LASSIIHAATAGPLRVGRVLAMMIFKEYIVFVFKRFFLKGWFECKAKINF
jgi:hypothetical protein